MPRETLRIKEFLVLHEAILNRYQEECIAKGIAIPSKQSAKYGFGKHLASKHSILDFMKVHPAIANYMEEINKGLNSGVTGFQEINGKNLYNKFLEVQGDSVTEITLSEPYSIIYPLYVDCNNLGDFKEKYNLIQQFEFYVGYYYSHQGSEVKSFDFKIAYSGGICDIEVNGFHENRRQDPFKGVGKAKSNNLFISLTNPEEIELNLIIPLEGNQFQSPDYLQGVLTTITSDNFPISVRIFLFRMPANVAKIPEQQAIKVKRYLNLHRQILRAPNERIHQLEELSVRGEYIEDLVDMVGVYWVWRYIEDNIVQIKMTINNDFTVQVIDPTYTGTFSKQIGRLNSSRIFHHNLCISTFPSRADLRQQIISYYLVALPQGNSSNWKYLKGIYSNVGDGTHKSAGGMIAIYKEQVDKLDVDAQIIRRGQISDYLEEYPELVPLKTMLDMQMGKTVV